MFTPIKREPTGFVNEMASPRTPQSTSLSRELKQVLRERNLLTAKTRDKVCNMLSDSPSNTPYAKNRMNPEANKLREFRLQAVQEIITSEKNYLNQLEILMKYFVVPIKEKHLMDDATHTSVFGQLEMIYNLNREFHSQLEMNSENVAPAFLKMAPFFKIYSVYAFDYRNALIKLQECYSHKPLCRQFIEEAETRPEVQRKLNSLMIIPIQRVPRYRLLLEQLLLYTSPADQDFKVLKESVKLIENTIAHINSCVEEQETTQYLINIQNSLVNRMPNIVKPSRKVLKEGILSKVNRKGVELKRYCVLMSDIFMYCKIHKERTPNTVVENSLECCCIFPLKKCKVYEMFPGTFKLTCQSDGAIFSTNDMHLSSCWVAFIREAIEMHIQCRKTLRKESSKRTPLRKKELKNFDNDYVISPSKRKCDYDKVFRTVTESDDEHNPARNFVRHTFSKFAGFQMQKKDSCMAVKRKCPMGEGVEENFRNLYTPPPQSQPQGPSNAAVRNLSHLYRRSKCMFKRPMKINGDLFGNTFGAAVVPSATSTLSRAPPNSHGNEHDHAYGFANRFSDTTSYFRAHNVDNTIPTASNMQDIMKDAAFADPNFRDVLYPLRLSGGKGNANAFGDEKALHGHVPPQMPVSLHPPPHHLVDNKSCTGMFQAPGPTLPNSWVFQPRESNEFMTSPPQKKRVKFEGVPDLRNEGPEPKRDNLASSKPYSFNYEETKPNQKASLSAKISKFFSNLWFTAFK